MRPITIRAFAKLNLSLRVKDTRADGFHELQTIFQAVDLYDRVTFAPGSGPVEIRCAASGVPTDRSNIVWKAAARLWRAAGRDGDPRDVVITLEKRIPVRAGLGGGSSNAAAALVGLRRLWKLGLDDGQLFAIAAELGSDVPYFFVGGTALGLGRGEQVYALADLPRWPVVIVVPAFGVTTKDAYGWLDEQRQRQNSGSGVMFQGHSEQAIPPRLLALPCPGVALSNDLEEPVVRRFAEIGRLKQGLCDRGAMLAAMSGSGSAVFGVFESATAAILAAKALKRGGKTAFAVRFLPRRKPRSLPRGPAIV